MRHRPAQALNRNARPDPAGVLDPQLVEALAHRVAEILRTDLGLRGAPPLVSATRIAELFGVSRSWVYENAERLGAVRLGTGERGRLRFDPEHVARILVERETDDGAPPPSTGGRRPHRWVDEKDLIPVYGS